LKLCGGSANGPAEQAGTPPSALSTVNTPGHPDAGGHWPTLSAGGASAAVALPPASAGSSVGDCHTRRRRWPARRESAPRPDWNFPRWRTGAGVLGGDDVDPGEGLVDPGGFRNSACRGPAAPPDPGGSTIAGLPGDWPRMARPPGWNRPTQTAGGTLSSSGTVDVSQRRSLAAAADVLTQSRSGGAAGGSAPLRARRRCPAASW
jgi:hypothetical protein